MNIEPDMHSLIPSQNFQESKSTAFRRRIAADQQSPPLRALCIVAALCFLPLAVGAGDATQLVIPQSWAVGASNSTYQEWDRFTSTTNNLPDLGWQANPSATSTSKLAALPPGALSGTGNFYAFAGDYAFQADVFNNTNGVPANWGTHVIVQAAATVGTGGTLAPGTMSLVAPDGTSLAGGEPTAALRYDLLFAGTVSGGPAGPVTQREELWEFYLPGHAGDFRVQASLKQHASLRQVRIDTQRAERAQPLIRIPIRHPETNVVDFSNDGNAPTSLGTFGAGLHLITAHFGDDGSNNDDNDLFTFNVPAGHEITSLKVLSYAVSGNNGNGSFFAIAAGPVIGTTMTTATNHLGNRLFSGPGELLDKLAEGAYFGTPRIAPHHPLPAGDYTVFLSEIAAGIDLSLAITVSRAPLQFQLLTWSDTNATAELPSAAGRKPSAAIPTAGDWLVFTGDDALLAAGNNSAGAVSHNFVDITGAGGPGLNLAPSLSGSLSLRLEAVSQSTWAATLTALAYGGQANPVQAMNQFLVTRGSPAVSNAAFNVDGVGNSGQWTASAANHWAIQFNADFFFATSADGDPGPADIDATFDDEPQTGFLIPVNQITTDGLAAVILDDPLGFHAGDFEQYLLEQIKPRLPADATYLLVTQMGKTHPGFAELGLPITTNSLIGNTTIAYTTATLGTAPQIQSLQVTNQQAVLRFLGGVGQSYSIQHSTNLTDWEAVTNPAFTYPAAGVVQWSDPAGTNNVNFYRVEAITP